MDIEEWFLKSEELILMRLTSELEHAAAGTRALIKPRGAYMPHGYDQGIFYGYVNPVPNNGSRCGYAKFCWEEANEVVRKVKVPINLSYIHSAGKFFEVNYPPKLKLEKIFPGDPNHTEILGYLDDLQYA